MSPTHPSRPFGPSRGSPAGPTALIALAFGNTRARVGLFRDWSLQQSEAIGSGSSAEIIAAVDRLAEAASHAAEDAWAPPALVVASVNPSADAPVVDALTARHGRESVYRIGRDVPVPLRHTLENAATLGQDRALNAVAAFARAGQACVVVDAGTAVTVDFVDGEGVFHGGVIAPGVSMMLAALHEHTAALPSLPYARPDAARGCFGKDTPHAMRLGVTAALRGLVRDCLDRYAEFYEAYPQVIATGGDMALLEDDGLVEHFVPDLQLMGIAACARAALAADEHDERDDPADQADRGGHGGLGFGPRDDAEDDAGDDD